MAPNNRGEKTVVQKLRELVDWFIMDREVQLEFSYNEKRSGKLVPEYDCYYYMDGRRVTERGLSMAMTTEFLSRDYRFPLSQVICAINARALEHYLQGFTPPEWVMADNQPKPPPKPRGRPRKRPETMEIPQP